MAPIKNSFYFYLFIVAVVSGILILFVQPYNALSSDALVKIIQGKSLAINKYESEEIYYASKAEDPEYIFFPLRGVYLLKNKNGEFIGQYPILFSLLISLVSRISSIPIGLVLLAWISFVVLAGVNFFCDLKLKTHYFFLTGTYFLMMLPDISESVYFVLFYNTGIIIFYNILRNKINHVLISAFGGAMVGLSAWLRIEGLLFVALLAVVMVFLINYKIFFQRQFFIWFMSMSLVVFAFFGFNYWISGHILGARFISNQGYIGITLGLDSAIKMLTLLFGARMNIGLFGFIPIFFIIIVMVPFVPLYKKFRIEERILFISSCAFILLASLLAPNAGEVNWGSRYLYCSILPFCIILDRSYDILMAHGGRVKRFFKVAYNASIVWSVLLLFIGCVLLAMASRQNQKFRSKYADLEYNFIVFDSGWLASQVGMDYFASSVYLISDKNDFPKFRKLVKTKYPDKQFVYIQSNFPDNPEIKQGRYASLLRSKFNQSWKQVSIKNNQLYNIILYQSK